MFIGSNIMEEIGIDLAYSTKLIQWDNCVAPMKHTDNIKGLSNNEDLMAAQLQNNIDDTNAPAHVQAGAKRAMRTLDAKYKKKRIYPLLSTTL